MKVYDPTGKAQINNGSTYNNSLNRITWPKAQSGQQPRIGIIENGNANAEFILGRIAELVTTQLNWDKETKWVKKPSSGQGIVESDLNSLLAECQIILAGTAD